MSDPTQMIPQAGGPPPSGPPPRGPDGPGGPGGNGPDEPEDGAPLDQRQKIVLGVLAGVIVLLLVVLGVVALGGDDSTDVATTSTTGDTTTSTAESTTTSADTTTSTETTTTTSSTTTTTTAPPTTTTTTTAPPPTIAPARCTGRTGPNNPDPVAMVFYDAWTLGDRGCAEEVATDDAVETLFRASGAGASWTFQGCDTVDDPEPHTECIWSYEGGASFFTMEFEQPDGWRVTAVDFVAD